MKEPRTQRTREVSGRCRPANFRQLAHSAYFASTLRARLFEIFMAQSHKLIQGKTIG
jgi:cyclophilin family peptidyl-prolyl cis-trans isomerase